MTTQLNAASAVVDRFAPETQQVERAEDICVTELVSELSHALESAIGEIYSVNAETKVLALNARIEAARAGRNGAAFGIVAEEIQTLSQKTSGIADAMTNRTRENTAQLLSLIDGAVRGTRLSDLALMNIDLIDRNLYERTCDVRWWATDGSIVDALQLRDPDAIAFASKRLGVILDAYTVYWDLVLCDPDGRVIANGRPSQFSSVGDDQASEAWFRQAMHSRSGDEYGFQYCQSSALVGDQPALIYSCSVREGGDARGDVIGALGIVFHWDGLIQPILTQIPVAAAERAATQAYIIDDCGRILASNQVGVLGEQLEMTGLDRVFNDSKGTFDALVRGVPMCIGHAKAPGFETYSTGWYSLVMQPAKQ